MPTDRLTLSDGHCSGERAPTRRSGAVEVGWCFTLTPHRTGCSIAATSLRERSRSIPDPMPAVGPSLRPCTTGGRSADHLAGCGTRPRRRASGRPCPAHQHACRAGTPRARQRSQEPTGQLSYRTASHRSATCLVACPVLPEGPAVPGSGTHHQEGDQDPGSRHRWVAAHGDLAIPPESRLPRLCWGNGLALSKWGCPAITASPMGPTMLRQPWRRQAHRPARCGRIRCRRVHRPPAAPGQGRADIQTGASSGTDGSATGAVFGTRRPARSATAKMASALRPCSTPMMAAE
jgi:hypothetical protein